MPRVLIVDDNEHLLRVSEIAVRRAGYDVDIANNACTGLQLLRRQQFDLVLADQRMPGMDGTAFLSEAARLYHRGKVALMTGAEHAEVARAGCPYLLKPFTTRDLIRFLNAIFERPG